jgi:uncharacterized protein (TIGR00251 family)
VTEALSGDSRNPRVLTVPVRETREGTVRIEVEAKPRSRESRIAGVRNGALVVHLAAPPVDGEANAELVATLARLLGIARRDVTIVRGQGARSKVVEVRGLSGAEVQVRLRA